MRKILLLTIVSIALYGCGKGKVAQLNARYNGYSKICVDNVTYIQFISGATIARDMNDKIVRCDIKINQKH